MRALVKYLAISGCVIIGLFATAIITTVCLLVF